MLAFGAQDLARLFEVTDDAEGILSQILEFLYGGAASVSVAPTIAMIAMARFPLGS